ncbi:MAG: ATP-binding cassette domain-containing protein [Sulfurovum sp.]|nr:ATP-binding cassette domain-containing protein [Sulfurovum sp.]
MLNIENLTYSYKTVATIYTYHFALQMSSGKIIGVLGESGSGKSTMLDLIAGFLDADSGSVKLDDEELLELPIEKRPVTILFQQHNLFEHLSVHKNILLGINPKGKANKEQLGRVKEILSQMNLSKHEQKLATELSGGQQQRVALARALLRNKPILLLDEPFTGLDRETRLQMLDLVKKITEDNNLHTIMITHEIEDCNLLADQVYSMKDGILKLDKSFSKED